MLFPAVRHEVWFWHGADRLAGDLALPETPGPHPVLAVVGDPRQGERDRSHWRDDLAAAGIATFSWDRPGHGLSARTAPAPGPDDPRSWAREVLAAIRKLHCLPDVDRSALALIGFGTGGWAAAQAATFGGDVRALILACTPMVPRPRPSDARTAAVDPRPTLSTVTAPVLALFGELDPITPLEASIRGVRQALGAAGHPDHEVAVVAGGDHALRVRPGHGLGGMIEGRHRFGDWPAGLSQHLLGWLDGRLRPAARIPAFVPPDSVTPDSVTPDSVTPDSVSPPSPTVPSPAAPAPAAPAPSAPAPAAPPVPVTSGQPVPSGQQVHPSRHPGGRTQLPVRQVRRRVPR